MARILAILGAVFLAATAFAHDGNHAHDDWYKSLRSGIGYACCDGSDAFSVLDPDWEMTRDPENPYRVRLEGEWYPVHKTAIVEKKNIVGVAKVWPVKSGVSGKYDIRCFLKGAET